MGRADGKPAGGDRDGSLLLQAAPRAEEHHPPGGLTGLTPSLSIRRAERSDAHTLLELIDALADYEKLERPDSGARERLVRDGFSDNPRFDSFLCELESRAVGYALVFETYSSFLAQPTLYLEDVFVLPEERRAGVGGAFLRFLAAEALRRGCARMEWMVLTWNEPAIRFYDRLGARRLEEWAAYRLTREDLERVAREP